MRERCHSAEIRATRAAVLVTLVVEFARVKGLPHGVSPATRGGASAVPRPVSLVRVDAESHSSRVGCGECTLASSRVGPNGPSDGFLRAGTPRLTGDHNAC